MENLPALIKKRGNIFQQIKARIVNNEENILGILSKALKGNKNCVYLLGSECIGKACPFFMEFKDKNPETGKEFTFNRCKELHEIILLEAIRDRQDTANQLLIKNNELLEAILKELKQRG